MPPKMRRDCMEWMLQAISWMNTNPNLSGWAQAIGAILAIFAAFLVAALQHASGRALQEENRRLDEIRRFKIVKAVLAKALVVCTEIRQAWHSRDMGALEPLNSQYILDCKASLEALPVFEVP